MVERAGMALTQIRSELQNAGSSVRLQLVLQPDGGLQRVIVLLRCDNYSDVLATSAQVLYSTRELNLSWHAVCSGKVIRTSAAYQ